MKKLLLLTAALLFVSSARPQSTSHTWIDVTASPYSVKNDCSASASSGINSAISGAPAGSGVVFFPAGCYLITAQIVDTNASAFLTYLGEGTVEFRASGTPSGSVIQFGNDTTTVTDRQIENLYFNCNNINNIDGIDLDGLTHSAFDDVVIANCAGTGKAAMRTIGTNLNNYSNVYKGGTVFGTTNSNGVQLGVSYPTAVGNWSFYGTTLVVGGTGNTGIGLDYEGAGGGFFGGTVEGWSRGIVVGYNNSNAGTPPVVGGFEISGSYLENNPTADIQLGQAGFSGYKAVGVTITGNYINCNNDVNHGSYTGIQLEQASGFSIISNRIRQCATWGVNGLADGTNQGADNGLVAANFLDGGQPVKLLGSNNTVTTSIATKSANYTLSGADSWINVTGNTTITIPHAMIAQRWDVFNSGTGNVSLVCDSGTINGESTLSVSTQTGKTVTADGTNCFAH